MDNKNVRSDRIYQVLRDLMALDKDERDKVELAFVTGMVHALRVVNNYQVEEIEDAMRELGVCEQWLNLTF